jgi:hypothetical protein
MIPDRLLAHRCCLLGHLASQSAQIERKLWSQTQPATKGIPGLLTVEERWRLEGIKELRYIPDTLSLSVPSPA